MTNATNRKAGPSRNIISSPGPRTTALQATCSAPFRPADLLGQLVRRGKGRLDLAQALERLLPSHQPGQQIARMAGDGGADRQGHVFRGARLAFQGDGRRLPQQVQRRGDARPRARACIQQENLSVRLHPHLIDAEAGRQSRRRWLPAIRRSTGSARTARSIQPRRRCPGARSASRQPGDATKASQVQPSCRPPASQRGRVGAGGVAPRGDSAASSRRGQATPACPGRRLLRKALVRRPPRTTPRTPNAPTRSGTSGGNGACRS